MNTGVIGRAVQEGIIEVECVNFRTFARDRYGTVDDTPYGGGPGMVLKVEPIVEAVESLDLGQAARLMLMSPRGAVFNQETARRLSGESHLVFICGRYEGIDERVREILQPEEISLGDFVLTGGELAALSVADAVCRLIPGTLGCAQSSVDESFSDAGGGLEYPQYTKPRVFRGHGVPDVLVGGDHGAVAEWRESLSREITQKCRPDLFACQAI